MSAPSMDKLGIVFSTASFPPPPFLMSGPVGNIRQAKRRLVRFFAFFFLVGMFSVRC